MLFTRGESIKNERRGRSRLRIIVICQYVLLFFSGLGSAAAIYLAVGPTSRLLIAADVAVFTAAGLSSIYLLLHQIGAWKYSRNGIRIGPRGKSRLLPWTRIVNVLAIFVWLAASTLGLMISSNSPFCVGTSASGLFRQNWPLDNCKIQKAGVATTIVAMVVSIVLFSLLATIEHPFAASLTGLHLSNHDEDDTLQLSRASFASARTPRRHTERPSYDTSIYSPSFQPSFPEQESWIPKLNFATPTEQSHPARRTFLDDIQLLRSQSNLLPSPTILRTPQGPSQSSSVRGRPTLKRSQTTKTVTSSIYSRSTTDSTCSNRASTLSCFSDDSGIISSPNSSPISLDSLTSKPLPAVPAIPEQYRTPPIKSLRNGGQPMRPHSRPPMPPASFWDYARGEQRRHKDLLDEKPPPAMPITRPRPHTEEFPGKTRYPSPPDSPKKALLRPNINRANTINSGRVCKNRSYESLRKGRSLVVGSDPWTLQPESRDSLFASAFSVWSDDGDESGKEVQKVMPERQSRTLIKKRQPWDRKPRSSVELRKL